MTSYATCAYPGCYRRIAYHPGSEDDRPRYCEEHLEHMFNRLPTGYGRGSLYIKVKK